MIKPFGTWTSPLSADKVASSTKRLRELRFDGDTLYWTEGRPTEGGREVLVRAEHRQPEDVLPGAFSTRARVHEYGGGAFIVDKNDLFFINDRDQKLYRRQNGICSVVETPSSCRYADFIPEKDHRTLIAVEEKHAKDREAEARLVRLSTNGGEPTVLAEGHDFYSSPTISPDGKRLAWLQWSHPNMPWDGTELWTAKLTSAGLKDPKQVAGGKNESVFQPQWSPKGVLHFASDASGYWNLYRYEHDCAFPLWPREAEFGYPQWVFGLSTYAFFPDGTLLCSRNESNRWYLSHGTEKGFRDLPVEAAEILYVRAGLTRAAFVMSHDDQFASICTWEPKTGKIETLASAGAADLDPALISTPTLLSFPTTSGGAHSNFYPPKNPEYSAPKDTRPPLIVSCHGGPTGAASTALSLNVQYWTSRGFAWLEVNFGGSTGYGRAFRERLYGQWGIVDVDDTAEGASFVASKGWADPSQLVIRGSSSGGFTALLATIRHRVFKAGAIYFGVADLEALARDTHKFESRYDKTLLGAGPDVAKERSPLSHVDKMASPLIFFQGLEDRVVPPSQSEKMVAELKTRGVKVDYVSFPGEGHGFRRAETLETCLRSELEFYREVFGWARTP